jgi:hypothetical protein
MQISFFARKSGIACLHFSDSTWPSDNCFFVGAEVVCLLGSTITCDRRLVVAVWKSSRKLMATNHFALMMAI